MKKNKLFLAVTLLLGLNTAYAEGALSGKIGTSYNQYATLSSRGIIKSNYESLNLGLAYSDSSGWFYDAGIKTSLKAKWDTISSGNGTQDESYKRNDYTLTIGKNVGEFNLFGGYLKSDGITTVPPSWSGSDELLSLSGLYAGISKSIPIENSLVNMSFAYANLTGELHDRNNVTRDIHQASGGSYGLSYIYPYSQDLSISFDAKYQMYRISFKDSTYSTGTDWVRSVGLNLIHKFK